MTTANARTREDGRLAISTGFEMRVGLSGFDSGTALQATNFHYHSTVNLEILKSSDRRSHLLLAKIVEEIIRDLKLSFKMNLDILYDTSKNHHAIDLVDAEIEAIYKEMRRFKVGSPGHIELEINVIELKEKRKGILEKWTPNKFIAVRINGYGLVIVGVSSGNIFYGEYENSTGMYRLFRNKSKVFKHKGV